MSKRIEIPGEFMGVPVSKETLKEALESTKKRKTEESPHPNALSLEGFEYVPSIRLYVAKEKELFNNDWNQTQESLHQRGDRMPTILEYITFINHLRTKNDEESRKILDEIYTVRNPWRSEWLDAKFIVKDSRVTMEYHTFTNSKIEEKSIDLQGILMGDKTPGIDLNSWLSDNEHGLPKQNIQDGQLYFWHPRTERVARFGANSDWAYLGCGGGSGYHDSSLGVRVARAKN
jgi:hypothetical protein